MSSTILCVDDDPGFCRILGRAFREQGHDVLTAADGDSALDQVRSRRPDLVTLDVMLPRRDGFSVLEEIRSLGGPHLPVILLSGARFTPEYETRASQLAVDEVLTKPVPLWKLLEVVDRLAPQDVERVARPIDLSGSLDDLPFALLLHHLHGMRASGVLRVENQKKKKLIQLRDGQPATVRSNMMKETLGHLLVASGTITWDVLHESVRRVKEGEGLQGQILKAMYMLDDADLARALHHQSSEKLLEVFEWRSGTFRFEQGARIRGEAAGLKRSPASLILDGVRQRSPIEQVDGFLQTRADLFPVPGGSPFHEFQEIEVDEAWESAIAKIDGTRSVGELLSMSEEDRRVLMAMIATGQVELEPKPAARVIEPRVTGRVLEEKVRVVDDRCEDHRLDRVRTELTELAERFQGDDPHAMFGLARTATDPEIRQAYSRFARQTHPDRYSRDGDAVRGLAEQVFDRVTQAYQAIATEADRQRTAQQKRDDAELEAGQQALRAELAFQRGERALRARLHDEAVECFAEAVKAYPEEGEYHCAYGWALYVSDPERIKEAKRHALHGKKLAPDRSAPLLVLGRLCKAEEKPEMAEKLFSKAVELDPDCAEALQELRLIALRKRNSSGILTRILKRSA